MNQNGTHELISICNRRPMVWFLMCLDNLSALLVTRFSPDSKQSESTRFKQYTNKRTTRTPFTVALNHEISVLFVLFIHLENACTPSFFTLLAYHHRCNELACWFSHASQNITWISAGTPSKFTINNKRTTLLSFVDIRCSKDNQSIIPFSSLPFFSSLRVTRYPRFLRLLFVFRFSFDYPSIQRQAMST